MSEFNIVPPNTIPLEVLTRLTEALVKLEPKERAAILECLHDMRPKYIYMPTEAPLP